jgi:hypothetical protein
VFGCLLWGASEPEMQNNPSLLRWLDTSANGSCKVHFGSCRLPVP